MADQTSRLAAADLAGHVIFMTQNDAPPRDPARRGGHPETRRGLTPPVTHASTILARSLADFEAMAATRPGDDLTYALHGAEGVYAFADALTQLEGGFRTRICQSGLSAVTAPLLAFLSAGDHLLMTDSVYDPVRKFCDGMLRRFGVSTTYYDPLIGAGIADLIQPTTRLIFLESPGSLTFEVQDVPAIAAVAAERDIWTAIDNTWASPLYFKPLAHGVDISIQALTKYVAGHGDLLLGSVTTTQAAYDVLQSGWYELGHSAGPDDVYLAHRGLATLELRMRRHWDSALAVARRLAERPEIAAVMHPALPGAPGHALWRRDFGGAGGLFSVLLTPEASDPRGVRAMVDGLRRFGIGFSWGGPKSLIMPADPAGARAATPWPRPETTGIAAERTGKLLRLFIGLEDPGLLIDDLETGLARLRAR